MWPAVPESVRFCVCVLCAWIIEEKRTEADKFIEAGGRVGWGRAEKDVRIIIQSRVDVEIRRTTQFRKNKFAREKDRKADATGENFGKEN